MVHGKYHLSILTLQTVSSLVTSSSFFRITPQCTIPNGNQRNESKVLICSSDRSYLGRADLGKVSTVWNLQFIMSRLLIFFVKINH